MAKLKVGSKLECVVEDLAFGGKGICKAFGPVIFIDGAIPGQKVELKITKSKPDYAEGKILQVLQRSDLETESPYQIPPGAPWMALPIEIQQKYKKQQVLDLFQKNAKIDIAALFTGYKCAPVPYEYRNKMEYSFGFTSEEKQEDGSYKHFGFGLGSKKRGQNWLVTSLEKPSGLFDADFEELMPLFRQWCESTGRDVYSSKNIPASETPKGLKVHPPEPANKPEILEEARTKEDKNEAGFWRQLVVRKSFSSNTFLIALVTSPIENEAEKTALFEAYKNFWLEHLGNKIEGLFWQETDILSDDFSRYKDRHLVCGNPILHETLLGLNFQLSMDAFFQPNPKAAEILYQKVMDKVGDLVSNESDKVILDLFSGTGTMTQLVKKQCPKARVIGVEIVEAATNDAKANAQRNGLTDLEFQALDVGQFLYENPDLQGQVDLVIMDPPRAGLSFKSLRKVARLGANYIIYVSCNPATLSRDVAYLHEHFPYKLTNISLVDQFPHTSHVEAIAILKKYV